VYVVVCCGNTCVVEEPAVVPCPLFGSMSTLVELLAKHLRITPVPGAGDTGGVAVKDVIIAAGVTRTLVVAVTEPVAFVAVRR